MMAQKQLSVSRDASPIASFGEWISHRRRHLGLTQKALAARARCSVAWVKKIEQDRHPPGEELAAALAQALEIPRHMHTVFIRAVRMGNVADLPAPDTLEALPEPPSQAPLPSQPTRFFGRVRELEEISRALEDPGCRLLTLLGPGGIGKTRLALYAAEQLKSRFDAVTFVSLREVDLTEGIAPAIADALQLPHLAQADPALQIAAYLRQVQPKTLLILDNFEHLTDGAEVVDILLESAREVQTLVTSRERLRSVWEQSLILDGLEYPVAGNEDNPEEYSSVQLFVERARRAFSRFPKSELPDVARLCGLVEGHPLAIELAAAWVASFACSEIVTQVENNIEMLKKQRVDLSDAHRSVAAAFDYSYTLLAPPEQQVFRTLGLFEGGFEPEAAAHIAGAARRTLVELVDKSLVQREGRRFNLHELLRLYALEKLAANTNEEHKAGALMARYFLDYSRTHRQDYATLELEWSNFNAGLRLAHQQGEGQIVKEYVTTLQQPWEKRGRYSDMRQAYRFALEAAQTSRDERAYADILREWGRACIEQGDYAEAEKYLEQSLDIARRIEYQEGIANSNHDLAWIDREQSEFDRARVRLETSQKIRRELGDRLGVAAAYYDLANVEYFSRNFELAASHGLQALAIQKQANDKESMMKTLRALAHYFLQIPDSLALAEEYGSLAIRYCDELGDKAELAATLRSMAEVSRRQNDFIKAMEYADKSLALFKLIGDRKSQARTLYTLSLIYQYKFTSGANLRDWELALKTATASLDLCIELNDELGKMYVLTHLGEIYHSQDDNGLAREYWMRANNVALSLNSQFAQEIQAKLGTNASLGGQL